MDDWILDKPNNTVVPDEEEFEQPIQVDVDTVDLLMMVVDDLCVQVGELKEKMKDAKD